jgi:hypothetical protein
LHGRQSMSDHDARATHPRLVECLLHNLQHRLGLPEPTPDLL